MQLQYSINLINSCAEIVLYLSQYFQSHYELTHDLRNTTNKNTTQLIKPNY